MNGRWFVVVLIDAHVIVFVVGAASPAPASFSCASVD